jgi:putative transposase
MFTPIYASDLTDAEWMLLAPFLPPESPIGRPRVHSLRTILTAIFESAPHRRGLALPAASCRKNGLPGRRSSRTGAAGGALGRGSAFTPRCAKRSGSDSAVIRSESAGSSESQSVKTSGVGGLRGFAGGKQVNGRQRHLLVDTEGLVLRAVVHPADLRDRDGVKLVLHEPVRTDVPRLRHVWLDSSYNGKGKGKDWIEQTLGWSAEIVAHRRRPSKVWIFDDLPDDQIDWSKYLPPPGFRVLPRRWVIERTFAWQGQQRRLSKDYERLCVTSEALIYVAMIRLMLRRLARS